NGHGHERAAPRDRHPRILPLASRGFQSSSSSPAASQSASPVQRKPGPARTKPASARKGASGLSASGRSFALAQPMAERPVSAAQRASANATPRAVREHAGSSAGRNVRISFSPLPRYAASAPSTSTTWVSAARARRAASVFGQGSAAPYGVAGSVAASTTAGGTSSSSSASAAVSRSARRRSRAPASANWEPPSPAPK